MQSFLVVYLWHSNAMLNFVLLIISILTFVHLNIVLTVDFNTTEI